MDAMGLWVCRGLRAMQRVNKGGLSCTEGGAGAGGQEEGGDPGLAALTRDRVSRLPAALWYRSGLPNCSSSQRILHSMLASSFSSISFLGGTLGSVPHTPQPCHPPYQAEGCLVPKQRLPQPRLT